jgi:hypothetical protein
MDSEEEAMLRTTVAEITRNDDGAQLTSALDQFGWPDMLAANPGLAVPAVFQGQGVAGTWSSAFHDVLSSAVEVDPNTVVLIPWPGSNHTGVRGASTIQINGIISGGRPNPSNALVSVGEQDRSSSLIGVPMSELTVRNVNGLDPELSTSLVTGSISHQAKGEDAGDLSRWDCALANGRWALSHQLIGLMDAMQMLALSHALERSQFGRQIGSFQAIRHRLAEAHVATEAARSAAYAARPFGHPSWERFDASMASELAKLISGRSAIKVTAHCQQVLAGIGFTSDHPFHRFMKRAVVLERMLGDAEQLAESVGRRLAVLGEAPRVIDL